MTTERRQFEEDPEIKSQLDKIKEITADYERGHVLLWEIAEQCLGMDRNDDRLKYVIKKWRSWLEKTKRIETWAIPGTGIKLLTQSEHVSLIPKRRAKKAYRQHGLILRGIRNTNLHELTERERLIAYAVVEHSRDARRQTNKVSNAVRSRISPERAAMIKMAMNNKAAESDLASKDDN